MNLRISPSPAHYSPACDRNKEPILAVLRRVLGEQGDALEIASGTGQHVAHFAHALRGWTWQPSDCVTTPDALATLARDIALYYGGTPAEDGTHPLPPNVRTPLQLDVLDAADWSRLGEYDAIYCANMLHIAPWGCCAALMRNAARHLREHGVLIVYGPFFEKRDAAPPAPGNVAFDADLRARNAQWGIRQLDDVAREAARAGLDLRERVAMPANNLTLIFARG